MPYIEDTLTFDVDLTVDDSLQLVDILTPAFDAGLPHRRKDSYTLKIRANTGGSDVFVLVYDDQETVPIIVETINSTIVEEFDIDISFTVDVVKSWQIQLVGLVADFKLTSIALYHGIRPEGLTFYRHLLHGLGPQKKRIRVWPIIIDTLGSDVSVVPYIDNVAQPELVVNSDYPETFLYQFITDVFGVDHAMTLSGCDVFELFDISDPVGVQILPIAKRYDQVGSQELFRYGKIKEFSTRMQCFGGTVIPFTIYFQDNSKYTGELTFTDGKEEAIMVGVPKTVAGEVLRIEYGPTAFNFHRFYTLVKVFKSGKDTEGEWLPLVSDWEDKLQK